MLQAYSCRRSIYPYSLEPPTRLSSAGGRSEPGHVGAGEPEADDVGSPVAGGVGEEAWMLVDAPAARRVAEVRDHQLRRLVGAVGERARRVDAGVPAADYVEAPVPGGVGEEPRVEAGFTEVECFGDWDGSAASASAQLVIRAR